jgi:integrase
VSRSRDSIPSYRRHKRSGQAVVTIPLAGGKRKDLYLGPWKSPESKQAYARIVAQLQAGLDHAIIREVAKDLTIDEALVRFLKYCDGYYLDPAGKPSEHAYRFRVALAPLSDLYGSTLLAEFGPISLKTIRDAWIKKGSSRKIVNQYIGMTRQFLKWAVSEEIVAVAVLESLKSVTGLRAGRTIAPDFEPIQPADEKIIAAALPHLPPMVAALVQIQTLCASRGGELLVMKPDQIDRSGKVWVYSPSRHKNTHRGKTRQIFFGPKAQVVLEPWIEQTPAGDFIFNPYRGEVERHKQRSSQRKTPRYRSHMKRNAIIHRRFMSKKSNCSYTNDSYRAAITRACQKAFPLPKRLDRLKNETVQAWKTRLGEKGQAEVQAWREKHSFSPHQLRHLAATKIRKEYGIELSRILLGHSDIGTTQIYAEVDAQKAMDAASKIG